MKRDMDLVRDLVLRLEGLPMKRGDIFIIKPDDNELKFDQYTVDQVDYHMRLIYEAGLVEDAGAGSMDGYGFERLSWAGHDFADSVRDNAIWAKTKLGAMAAGGFTVQLLVDLAKGFVKKQIEERTGVKL
ncbi:DUF2513 domain-containing protein [Cupriavidus oxalaticus]|uniref:DUF2513 domain-containing protein n=1 Tax=Cupriavidus oxalaticus TaxID=96344 RepID=A0A4P7LSM3_9BURK|nr:DUF2513 domain-containing protein [Cupriavidus oxalaticus]QBY55501.1 DUF2513 domain-containing protein [Cupriavidus oxalaticus]